MTRPTPRTKIFDRRLSALRKRMALYPDAHLDTAWIIQPENRRYLSKFKATDTQFTESSGSLLITQSRSVLVTDSRYITQAQKEAPDFEVLTLTRDLVEELPNILETFGTRHLGVEEHHLTWGMHQRLRQAFDAMPRNVGLLPLNRMVEDMREIKDEAELQALADAARLISEIIGTVTANLQPGMTEKEVAYGIESLVRKGGAEGLSFPSIVASGPNSALPHAVPTDRKLQEGEPVIVDAGVRLNGYCSDMTRTLFMGTPREEFRHIYKTVRKAQSAAIKAIKPSVLSTHVDRVARQIIQEAGYGEYFGHGLGHGVGLATHEAPKLGPRRPVLLKEGMVATVEPGIYIPERGGVRLEEMVVVTESGTQILTRNPNIYDF
ncbi:MAG: Xaa-Pro peptidase family protein [Desulfatiglandaceae bacterium]